MELAARVDEYGKLGWIAVIVLGFIIFWPLGLAILAYTIWSGRMGCWKRSGPGRWFETKEGRESRRGRRRGETSGNTAFDEYREETLRRLEEEQEEFHQFLHRLRQAKDKSEFDQFMQDRRRRAADPDDAAGEPDRGGSGFRPSPGDPTPSPAG